MGIQRSMKRRAERQRQKEEVDTIACLCGNSTPSIKRNGDAYVVYCPICKRMAKGMTRNEAANRWNDDIVYEQAHKEAANEEKHIGQGR